MPCVPTCCCLPRDHAVACLLDLVAVTTSYRLVNWWGQTPALDLLQDVRSAETKGDDGKPQEINVLLMGAGDVRHILRTVAVARRKAATGSVTPHIHFWVAERNVELLARQMLLLALAYAPSDQLGLQLKVEMFLELFGNSMIRSQTSEYLAATASRLIDLVTDPDLMEQHFPLVNLTALKFREVCTLLSTYVCHIDTTMHPLHQDHPV